MAIALLALALAGVPTFEVYQLDVDRDLPIAGAGALLWTAYAVMDRAPRPDPCVERAPGGPCDPARVNDFDRISIDHVSAAANDASNVTVALAALSPMLLDAGMLAWQPYRDRVRGVASDAVLLAEILVAANGLDAVVK